MEPRGEGHRPLDIFLVFAEEDVEVSLIRIFMGRQPEQQPEVVVRMTKEALRRADLGYEVTVEEPQSANLTKQEMPGIGFGAAFFVFVTCPVGKQGEVFTALGQQGLFA